MLVVLFQSEQQIDSGNLCGLRQHGFKCLARTADDVICSGFRNTLSVGFDVVEVIAGNELSCQFFTTVAQSSVLIAHLTAVEINLAAYPAKRRTIGYARIFVQVETLFRECVTDGWRGNSVESVHHHHRMRCLRII